MASPETIDLSELLKPISAEAPCGKDVREGDAFNSLYQQLKDARTSARDEERSRMLSGEIADFSGRNWKPVMDMAIRVLQEESKDLEVVAWLTEALVRREGPAGVRDGLSLFHQLADLYWDTIFPLPDDIDGNEIRIAAFNGLNGGSRPGTLVEPLNYLVLTNSSDNDFALWQYKQALETDRIQDSKQRAERIENIGYSLEDITNAVQKTSAEFYRHLRDDLSAALATLSTLDRTLTQKLESGNSHSTGQIRDALQGALDAIIFLAKDKLDDPLDEIDSASDTETGTTETQIANRGNKSLSGPIANRDDAIRQLSEIARFFRETEPHSPLAYTIEKSVRWARMSFDELMLELIPDNSSRETFALMTGVRFQDSDDS